MDKSEARGGKARPEPMPRLVRWLITIVVVFGAAALIIGLLPRGGLSTDLSRIGQGTPVGVLTYETAHPASMDLMELVKEFQAEVPDGIEFLVAHLGSPDGDAFARQHNAGTPGLLVFFDGNGDLQTVLRAPDSTAQIRGAARSVMQERY